MINTEHEITEFGIALNREIKTLFVYMDLVHDNKKQKHAKKQHWNWRKRQGEE